MKDLGSLKYFLDIEVTRSSKGIYLYQQKYALDILANVGMLGVKPIASPMEQHHSLGKAKGPCLHSLDFYRRLIGHLIYLTITRLDLSCSVHLLVQIMHKPRQDHRDAAIRLLQYLKGAGT